MKTNLLSNFDLNFPSLKKTNPNPIKKQPKDILFVRIRCYSWVSLWAEQIPFWDQLQVSLYFGITLNVRLSPWPPGLRHFVTLLLLARWSLFPSGTAGVTSSILVTSRTTSVFICLLSVWVWVCTSLSILVIAHSGFNTPRDFHSCNRSPCRPCGEQPSAEDWWPLKLCESEREKVFTPLAFAFGHALHNGHGWHSHLQSVSDRGWWNTHINTDR